MLPLTIKGKEASFAVVSMNADSQLKMWEIQGFYDNLSLPPKKRQYRQEAIEKNS